MQSVSSKRIAPTPQFAAIAVVIALAILGGIVALEVTDNVPGRSGSSASVVNAPAAVVPWTAGDGQVSPRHLESNLGSGATLSTVNPAITFDRSDGQGEGIVGAGTTSSQATVNGSTADRGDMIAGNRGTLAPFVTVEQMLFLESNGVVLSELAPAGETTNQYVAGPYNQGFTDESAPVWTDYATDPHLGGPTER